MYLCRYIQTQWIFLYTQFLRARISSDKANERPQNRICIYHTKHTHTLNSIHFENLLCKFFFLPFLFNSSSSSSFHLNISLVEYSNRLVSLLHSFFFIPIVFIIHHKEMVHASSILSTFFLLFIACGDFYF